MTSRIAAFLLASLSLPVAGQTPTYVVQKFNIGGSGGSAHLAVEAATDRVFVPRDTHVMVVDGLSGKVLGDIPNTPQVRSVALAPRRNRGFTANAGDSTVTMFDLQTLAPIKQIKIKSGGLDEIWYDGVNDRVVLTSRGKPEGRATVIDPDNGNVLGTVRLADALPKGVASDDRGRIYVANELKNTVEVIDIKRFKVLHTWPLGPCTGPVGVAFDLRTTRLMVACPKRSVLLDGTSGKVLTSFENGDDVDGLAWDPADHLMYIPSAAIGGITVLRMASLNSFTPVATVKTLPGVRSLTHDPSSRLVFQFGFINGASVLVKVSH